MKFKVGQTVYLPSVTGGKSVEAVVVEAITISTDLAGAGGRYYYDTSGWDVCYRLSGGWTIHEGSLFGNPSDAFDHIEQRATPASA